MLLLIRLAPSAGCSTSIRACWGPGDGQPCVLPMLSLLPGICHALGQRQPCGFCQCDLLGFRRAWSSLWSFQVCSCPQSEAALKQHWGLFRCARGCQGGFMGDEHFCRQHLPLQLPACTAAGIKHHTQVESGHFWHDLDYVASLRMQGLGLQVMAMILTGYVMQRPGWMALLLTIAPVCAASCLPSDLLYNTQQTSEWSFCKQALQPLKHRHAFLIIKRPTS